MKFYLKTINSYGHLITILNIHRKYNKNNTRRVIDLATFFFLTAAFRFFLFYPLTNLDCSH